MRYLPYVSAIAVLVACEKPAPKPAAGGTGAAPAFHNPPDPAFATQGPDSFRAKLSPPRGDFVISVHRAWAPLGADRFYNLVRSGFFDSTRFFRVIPGFMAQFGLHADTAVTAAWRERRIPDDPAGRSNQRGMVTFATAGPGTRSRTSPCNSRLDGM